MKRYNMKQAKQQLNSTSRVRDELMLILSWGYGLDATDLTQLSRENIDMQNGIIKIDQTGRLVKLIAPHKKIMAQHFLTLPNGNSYLFLNVQGTPLTERSINKIFQKFGIYTPLDYKLFYIIEEANGHNINKLAKDFGYKNPKSIENMVYEYRKPVKCPECNGIDIVKNGSATHLQRKPKLYKCKTCNKCFML